MSLALIRNEAARRLFLDRHALIEPPTGPAKGADLLALIRRLGFRNIRIEPFEEADGALDPAYRNWRFPWTVITAERA